MPCLPVCRRADYYSPFNNLEAAKSRQATVLNQMVKYEFITAEEAEEAKAADLGCGRKRR